MRYLSLLRKMLLLGSFFFSFFLGSAHALVADKELHAVKEKKLADDAPYKANFLALQAGIGGFDTYFSAHDPFWHEKYGFTLFPLRLQGGLRKGRLQGYLDIDLIETIIKPLYLVGKAYPFSQVDHGIKSLYARVKISKYCGIQLGRESDYKETRDAITLLLSDDRNFNIHIAWNLPLREYFFQTPRKIRLWPAYDWFYKWNIILAYQQFKVDIGLDVINKGKNSKMLWKFLRTFEFAYGQKLNFAYSAVGFTPFGSLQTSFYQTGLDHRKYKNLNKPTIKYCKHAVQMSYIAPPIYKWDGEVYWGMRFLINFSGLVALHAMEVAFPVQFLYRLDQKFPALKKYTHSVETRVGWLPALVLPNKTKKLNDTTGGKGHDHLWDQQMDMWRESPLRALKAVGLESLWSCLRFSFSVKWTF